MNRHPQKNTWNSTTYHLGGDNASDVADLHKGRGQSADMPFATFRALWYYLTQNFTNSLINILVHGEVHIPNDRYFQYGPYRLDIRGNGSTAKLIFDGNIGFSCGVTAFSSITIDNTAYPLTCDGQFGMTAFYLDKVSFIGNPVEFLKAVGFAFVLTGSAITMNGSCSDAAISVSRGASVMLLSDITGNVTGKRYTIVHGGQIFVQGRGPNVIPGTVAGTVDETSIYA